MDRVERTTEKLIVREVEGETVVYNTATEMVTVLDSETAAVWQAADGRPVDAMAETLELPQEKVEVALVRLGDAGLLKAPMSRRTLLRGAGAAVAAGGLVTIMAPPAFAAASGVRKISGSGQCGVGQGVGVNDVLVTVTGDGFSAGNVTVTITYAGSNGTKTANGIIVQSQTGNATGPAIKLTNVKSGTITATVSGTDSKGNTISGTVALTSC